MLRSMIGIVAASCSVASAANVYVFSTGIPAADAAYVASLTGHGHTVTLGVSWDLFDGTASLAGIDVGLMNHSGNWSSSTDTVPLAGQQQLVDFVAAGGGLITTEWIVYNNGTSGGTAYALVAPILPVTYGLSWNGSASTTFTQASTDAVMNSGVPETFESPVDYFAGTETKLEPRPGATVFFLGSNLDNNAAVTGWQVGAGRTVSFSTMPGELSLAHANYSRLLSNAIDWANNVPPPCDPDMNQDGNVDQDDVGYLINVVGGGDNPTGIDPDFNQDGNVDQDDVAALIDTVGGGGCP